MVGWGPLPVGSKDSGQAGKSENTALNLAIYELQRTEGLVGPFVLIAVNEYIPVVL